MLTPDEESLFVDIAGMDAVKTFLVDSIAKKQKGDTFLYDQLVKQLRIRDDSETLWRVYFCLPSCIQLVMKR